MRRLKRDPFSRLDRPASRGPIVRSGLTPVVLIAISATLLLLSRIDHGLTHSLRASINEAVSPVVRWAAVPFAPLQRLMTPIRQYGTLAAENERLKAEIDSLRSWEWRARDLEARLAALAPIARTLPEQPMPFVTVRVIAASNGPFARAAMIDAGRRQGLQKGQPVVDAGGLVGRIVAVGHRSSQVLLLTDPQSRIPVEIGRERVRALLVGDNDAEPRLEFVARDAKMAPGEDVATSGAGGAFPRGLRVGRVVPGPQGPVVMLSGQPDRLEYASVLTVEMEVVARSGHRVTSSPGAPGFRAELERSGGEAAGESAR